MEEVDNVFRALNLDQGRKGDGESMQDPSYHSQILQSTISIHTLPPEVTSMIFSYLKKSLELTDSMKLPVTLAHVSHYWRNITLGIASFLWADIDFSPPWTVEKISTYLERSGTYPFSLNCVFPANFKFDSTEAKEAFSLVGANLARCRSFSTCGSIDIQCITSLTIAIFDLFSERELPLLETFSIESVNTTRFVNFHAPAITNLRLGRVCSVSPNFHFASLTTMHLAIDMEYEEFIHIITSCHKLITLAVYDDLIHDWPDLDENNGGVSFPKPVFLHDLRSIQIYGNIRSVSELLWSISAPSLNDLVIAPVVANDLTALGELCRKTSTFPSLTTLVLAPAHGYAFELLPIAYKCFPSIEHLVFANIYLVPFRRFFCDGDEDILWPNLKTFALRGVGPSVSGSIQKMISLRKDRGYPLQKLYLDSGSLPIANNLDIEVEMHDVWASYQVDAFYQDEEDRFLGIDEGRDEDI